MGLFGNNQDMSAIEDQLKILATNVEVLNQVLVKDPNLAQSSSDFGGMSQQQYHEMSDALKAISRKIETYDGGLREVVNQELEYIKTALHKLQELTQEAPRQKQELDIVVKRLNNVIEAFSASDKTSMQSVAKELHDFNANMTQFNENMQFFQQKLVENINFRVGEIGVSISNSLMRSAIVGIGVFVIIGVVLILVK